MIDLTYVRTSLTDDALAALTDDLVGILLRAEGAPDTEFLRQNTLVYLHPLEAEQVSVGGRGAGEPRFRVDLTVFGGVLDKAGRERLVADVHSAVTAAAGIDPSGRRDFHVWTLIHEVPEGNWGGGGKVIYYSDVSGLMDQTRQDPPPR